MLGWFPCRKLIKESKNEKERERRKIADSQINNFGESANNYFQMTSEKVRMYFASSEWKLNITSYFYRAAILIRFMPNKM